MKDNTRPAIALAGINLSLGAGAARVHILKDIDLNIGSGEAIGLIGPSGSGKSTLLMVMAALENVAVPLEMAGVADANERAARELAAVGLSERTTHYPAELSGGEQQRV